MNFKKLTAFLCAIFLLLSSFMMLTSCSDETSAGNGNIKNEDKLSGEEMFTDNDRNTSLNTSNAVTVTLSGNSASASSSAVEIKNSQIKISDEGIYTFTGNAEGLQIFIEAESTDKIQLILNGANLSYENGATILIAEADKVFITLAYGSDNKLISSGSFSGSEYGNVDASIFSKADLTFNGSGSLTVKCEDGNAISSKDELAICGGNYSVVAENHGIEAKDCLKIESGSFIINTAKDALHAENADNESLGFIFISGGEFDITSEDDGISASATLQIEGGAFTLTSAQKGIKSTENLIISGGSFNVNSSDDAFHSNASALFENAEVAVKTKDDGIHADSTLEIKSGKITVSESYEGLEALTIHISGGAIDVTASDDGINAAGGNDGSGFGGGMGTTDNFGRPGGFGGMGGGNSSSGGSITISGGVIKIDSNGDGIDSNGNLTVSGGECYVSGSTNSGNAALDYDGNAKITGGIFVALGAYSMAMNFGDDSTQPSVLLSSSGTLSGEVKILDADGNTLLSFTPHKSYNSVLVSCPTLKLDNSYTVYAGEAYASITLNQIIYGTGGGMGGGGTRPGYH